MSEICCFMNAKLLRNCFSVPLFFLHYLVKILAAKNSLKGYHIPIAQSLLLALFLLN